MRFVFHLVLYPTDRPENAAVVAVPVPEEAPDAFYKLPPDAKPVFDEQWFDDPIDGEEAIRMAVILQQKIEEKALPIRTWLETNIVPLLLQALGALVAHRPSNPAEYLAAYLIKYNPLKDKYPEDDPKPKKVIEEEIESDDDDDLCGCNQFKKKETIVTGLPAELKEPAKLTASQLEKKATIAADAKKATVVPDAERASAIAGAKKASLSKAGSKLK